MRRGGEEGPRGMPVGHVRAARVACAMPGGWVECRWRGVEPVVRVLNRRVNVPRRRVQQAPSGAGALPRGTMCIGRVERIRVVAEVVQRRGLEPRAPVLQIAEVHGVVAAERAAIVVL